eukprot:759082-Amphidinium_carterae.2
MRHVRIRGDCVGLENHTRSGSRDKLFVIRGAAGLMTTFDIRRAFHSVAGFAHVMATLVDALNGTASQCT